MRGYKVCFVGLVLALVISGGLFSCGFFDSASKNTPTTPSASSGSANQRMNCFVQPGKDGGFGSYVGTGFFQVNIPVAGDWVIHYVVVYTESAIQDALHTMPPMPPDYPADIDTYQERFEQSLRDWKQRFNMVVRTNRAGLITIGVLPIHAVNAVDIIPVTLLPGAVPNSDVRTNGNAVEIFGWTPDGGFYVPLNQLLPQDQACQIRSLGGSYEGWYHDPSCPYPAPLPPDVPTPTPPTPGSLGGTSVVVSGVIVAAPETIALPEPPPWGVAISKTIRSIN